MEEPGLRPSSMSRSPVLNQQALPGRSSSQVQGHIRGHQDTHALESLVLPLKPTLQISITNHMYFCFFALTALLRNWPAPAHGLRQVSSPPSLPGLRGLSLCSPYHLPVSFPTCLLCAPWAQKRCSELFLAHAELSCPWALYVPGRPTSTSAL